MTTALVLLIFPLVILHSVTLAKHVTHTTSSWEDILDDVDYGALPPISGASCKDFDPFETGRFVVSGVDFSPRSTNKYFQLL